MRVISSPWLGLFRVVGQALLASFALPALGGVLPVPVDLQPGDRYYLEFYTSPTTAQSSDVSVYNALANSQADELGIGSTVGVTWHAFVTTATEPVTSNIPTDPYPVYTIIRGLPELAASSPLLLATSGPLVPIGPSGGGTAENPPNPSVWTGINPTDLNDTSFGMGSPFVYFGTGFYTGVYAMSGGYGTADQSQVIYAISDPLTVPVPEPATWILAASALLGCAFALASRRTRNRRLHALTVETSDGCDTLPRCAAGLTAGMTAPTAFLAR